MDFHDTQTLLAEIRALYEGHCPTFNAAMTKLWHNALKPFEHETGVNAVERWARHHTFKPPTLDELLEQIEMVRDEAQQAKRWGKSDKTFVDALRDAAENEAANPLRSEEDATYARLMVVLAERSVAPWRDKQGRFHEKLTAEQRGEQCYGWARHYEATNPQLADDLRGAAKKFAELLYTAPALSAAVPKLY